jgi:hypothetical protein
MESMVNHDLALAICGAGEGPFIDKITSQAWDAVRHVTDVWEAAERIETMIKETYREFGQIYQTGACPSVELIYGIKIGGLSRLFHAIGPVVNERDYASSGTGYYMADFLAARMRGTGYLTVRQSVILAAYILLQAKEHVEGCGGDSHIAVLRESEPSGMVDYNLIEHLTKFLEHADHCTGETLLTASDFSLSTEEVAKSISESLGYLKSAREHEIKKMEEDKRFSLVYALGFTGEKDDLGITAEFKPSNPDKSGDQP